MQRLLLMVCLCLALASPLSAQEPKELGGKTKGPPKELTVDLGKGIKLEMVLIPAGEFMMGAPDSEKGAFEDEKPRHRVRIMAALAAQISFGAAPAPGEPDQATQRVHPTNQAHQSLPRTHERDVRRAVSNNRLRT